MFIIDICKKYLSISLEPPIGEAVLVLGVICILTAIGFIDGITALSWFIPGSLFISFILGIFLLSRLWQYKAASAYWYFYTIFIILNIIISIGVIVKLFTLNFLTLLGLLLFITSIFSALFAVMILLGKSYFTKKFWRIFFFLEIILIPLVLLYSYKVKFLTSADTLITTKGMIVTSIVYIVLVLPYFYKLYKYSFDKTK